jgi:hypothetical protein
MDSGDTKTRAPGEAGAPVSWRERMRDFRRLVPAFAVVTVVVTAVLATVMVKRSDRQADSRQSAVSLAPRGNELGAGPACRDCGVVESIVPSKQHGGYRLRIRMDDGTMRTVDQRRAVAAGSRVFLEGGSVRVMPPPARQG